MNTQSQGEGLNLIGELDRPRRSRECRHIGATNRAGGKEIAFTVALSSIFDLSLLKGLSLFEGRFFVEGRPPRYLISLLEGVPVPGRRAFRPEI